MIIANADIIDRLDPKLRESLDLYAKHGIPTGDCMRAVLAGDLYAAFMRADPIVTATMSVIVGYIVNRLPNGCWGSYELVDSWIATYRGQAQAAGRSA